MQTAEIGDRDPAVMFDEMVGVHAQWLDGSGKDAEVVISSRVRLARNLAGIRFTTRARTKELDTVISRMLTVAKDAKTLKRATYFSVGELSELDRQVLIERHLISPALAEREGSRGVLIGPGEAVSVMLNEEDHLRIQAFVSGMELERAFELALAVEAELGEAAEYSFSESIGYLTACPTNVGTGLRASVLIHLPALVLTQEMEQVLRGVTQLGLTVRGFYGEGTEVVGNLFQISNQVTLGKVETEVIEGLARVVGQIIEYERDARETLLSEARNQLEDKVWRSYGILVHARVLTAEEFMNLSSAARLGLSLGLLERPSTRRLNELMVITQPSHVQKLLGQRMKNGERDALRASLVRECVEESSGRGVGI